MAVEHETTMRRSTMTGTTSIAGTAVPYDRVVSQMNDDVLKRLPEGAARFVASAPGRLDVIGGIAEYTGALVVHTPLAQPIARRIVTVRLSSLVGNSAGRMVRQSTLPRAPSAAETLETRSRKVCSRCWSSCCGRVSWPIGMAAVRSPWDRL